MNGAKSMGRYIITNAWYIYIVSIKEKGHRHNLVIPLTHIGFLVNLETV